MRPIERGSLTTFRIRKTIYYFMNAINKTALMISFLLGVFTFTSFAQDDLLKRVPELQRIARLSNSGALGCGPSDFSVVFGAKVKVSQLRRLLEARVEFNRTGEQNPMSGDVSDLVYAILSELPFYKDKSVIAAVTELLNDKNEVIRGWSAISLFRMANESDELRKQIQKIAFPSTAVLGATSRGEKLPTWAKVIQVK